MSAAIWCFLWVFGSPLCILGLADSQRVKWCAVGHQERAKCDQWSAVSGGALACATEETPEDCMAAITVGSPASSSGLLVLGKPFGIEFTQRTHRIRFFWVCLFMYDRDGRQRKVESCMDINWEIQISV